MATFLPPFALPNASEAAFGFPNKCSAPRKIPFGTKGQLIARENSSQLSEFNDQELRHNDATSFGFPNEALRASEKQF
ncbi:hypothetical protein [Pleomorphomonas sp. NRK KF1]|uniref:hypothetical protein n=1 Tax=Pleomorphomonas sp. NRK KF1 TaxID=2943000 RepID=UPI0020444DEA|nr:hypothetical protein [Pleomorphomonas sp. NRK KF1]MCM5553428.1 hypothetical protein [Pleomorphomonas sp. NRK KF1]